VAAHLEPEILILDEVLAVGDAVFQKKCLGKMQDISSQHGRTILFVSHHMAAIRRLCQKCIVLNNGRATQPLGVNEAITLYSEACTESDYDLHLSETSRAFGTEARLARISHLHLKDGGLLFGRPFEMDVTVQCSKRLENAMLGIAFDTMEGVRILTLDSDMHHKYFELEPGEHVLRIRLEWLPLHPGFYQCSAALAAGGFFHDIVNVATWEVKTSELDHWSDRGFAGCRMDMSVEKAGTLMASIT
jgi:lipopolysaccharide transport system ATP-binding protein